MAINLGRSPASGRGQEGRGENGLTGAMETLSAARRRERDRPEMSGVIGDTTRGGDGRTDSAGVNYWGLNFREKKNWLRRAKSRSLVITRRDAEEFPRAASTPGVSGETRHTHGKPLISQRARACAVATIRTRICLTAREPGPLQTGSVPSAGAGALSRSAHFR